MRGFNGFRVWGVGFRVLVREFILSYHKEATRFTLKPYLYLKDHRTE